MIQQFAPEIIMILLLMAVFGLRARVNAGASLFVKSSPERLWEILNPTDGKTDRWGRTTVATRRVDGPGENYEMTYTSLGYGDVPRASKAFFGVTERVPFRRVVLHRERLEGRSTNNELLQIHHDITPEADGSRLSTRYQW